MKRVGVLWVSFAWLLVTTTAYSAGASANVNVGVRGWSVWVPVRGVQAVKTPTAVMTASGRRIDGGIASGFLRNASVAVF